MLRIGICDDEVRARDSLRLCLEKILRNDDEKVFYEFSSGEGVVSWVKKHRGEIDLLFLDVEMSGISGMEAARLIRQTDGDLLLVFVTGYADFVFDGYSVQAMDYIIKPAKEEKLAAVLSRARQQMENQQPETFTVQNADGLYRIPKKKILYFYSEKRLVKLVTAEREYAFYSRLDEVEAQIGKGFIRIHQRYLVCAAAVRKLESSSLTVGIPAGFTGSEEISLPVSRSLRQQVMLLLGQAMLDEGN